MDSLFTISCGASGGNAIYGIVFRHGTGVYQPLLTPIVDKAPSVQRLSPLTKHKVSEGRVVKNTVISLALIAGLAACSGGNPFDENTTDTGSGSGTDGGTDTGGETDGDGIAITDGTPPGTESPTSGDTIYRSEKLDEENGNGYANGISYNSKDDTFTVNNLPFDGDSPYVRGKSVSSLNDGRFAVYEAEEVAYDPANPDAEIKQFQYRAIYGVSKNKTTDGRNLPRTQFAIVRTGSYVKYGFGGFIYQRDGGVTLPETLQAKYTGQSAGLRDSNDGGDLQFTTADVEINIDSEDFDKGAGVYGRISNRRVFDLNGKDITNSVAATIGDGLTQIPDARLVIQAGVLQDSGDLVGEVASQYVGADGKLVEYERGEYYAIVAGDNADEIVGVFVLEADNSRDTGGFIVYRGKDE